MTKRARQKSSRGGREEREAGGTIGKNADRKQTFSKCVLLLFLLLFMFAPTLPPLCLLPYATLPPCHTPLFLYLLKFLPVHSSCESASNLDVKSILSFSSPLFSLSLSLSLLSLSLSLFLSSLSLSLSLCPLPAHVFIPAAHPAIQLHSMRRSHRSTRRRMARPTVSTALPFVQLVLPHSPAQSARTRTHLQRGAPFSRRHFVFSRQNFELPFWSGGPWRDARRAGRGEVARGLRERQSTQRRTAVRTHCAAHATDPGNELHWKISP